MILEIEPILTTVFLRSAYVFPHIALPKISKI